MGHPRYFAVLLLLILHSTLFAGGAAEPEGPAPSHNSAYPRTLTDSFNREVTLDTDPQRIVSLAPNITEILFALGEGRRLAGRTSWCDYPPEAAEVPVVGSLMAPSAEVIASLEPDLVIASTHFQRESLALLEKLDIPVLIFYGPSNFAGVFHTITLVAAALQVEEKAQTLIGNIRGRVEEIQNRVAGRSRPRVYYVIDFGETGNYTAGGGTFIDQLITMAGGTNIAADLDGWAYSVEMILSGDPDIVICPDTPGLKSRLMKSPGYRELRAVRTNQVFTIDVDLIDRQGPRLVEGLEALAKILHPGAF